MKSKMWLYLLLTAAAFVAFVVLAIFSVILMRTGKDVSLTHEGTLTIGERTFDVEVAETMAERAQGLSGKSFIGEDEGMLFLFGTSGNYSFWMKGMRFSIDIVWIRDSKVIGITEHVPPPSETEGTFSLPSYAAPGGVDSVLEVRAGEAARSGIEVGDTISFSRNEGS